MLIPNHYRKLLIIFCRERIIFKTLLFTIIKSTCIKSLKTTPERHVDNLISLIWLKIKRQGQQEEYMSFSE